jgi:N-acyl homoserine lactone hydrolase
MRAPRCEIPFRAALARCAAGGGRRVDRGCAGDGTVMVLNTPGHHSLMVKLPQTGNVRLTADLAHFRENYENSGVPSFNVNRAETVASIDRLKKIASNLKATVIIQHDARDASKLPAFPAAAK